MAENTVESIAKGISTFNLVSRVSHTCCAPSRKFNWRALTQLWLAHSDEVVGAQPVANAEGKAPDAKESLPPITKEPAATAEASMVPSVPAQSTTTDAPVAPSSDVTAKAEVGAPATEAQEDSTSKSSEPDTAALKPENPSNPAPAPEPEPATTETAASRAESSSSAGPDEAVEPLKPVPVSLEEIGDEDLADAKPSEPKKPAEEAPKTDAPAPAKNGNASTSKKRKAKVTEDTPEPEANSVETQDTEPPAKKTKTNGTTTNGAPRKPGRPRKDKNSTASVGKTARKTRSQGAAD
ncbi:hypothetical protein E0Z10_g1253 [Xylaria hypoxylon]|uniref:Uncharacterized protein n=1 Tax=Xylaria hypoxylon TaxID=37992 RepID=A0A4Z0ZF96_9PEZI|nr:hypothetical protein E0Z10_g1253 [Xylaria hypoxylon]